MRILKNLNYAIDSIVNKLVFSFLLIVQLTASIYFLYDGILITQQSSRSITKIESVFNTTNLFRVNDSDEIDNLLHIKFKEDSIVNRLKQFDDYLQTSNEFTCVRFNNNPLPVEKFNDNSSFINKNAPIQNAFNKSFYRLNALQGDKNFFKNYIFDISSGRYFYDTDFEVKDAIPIILGYDYSKSFKLDDVIKYYDDFTNTEKDFKVIGFLSKDCYFYQKTFSPDSVYNMNKYIMYPIQSFNVTNMNPNDADYESKMIEQYFSSFLNTMLISNHDEAFLQNLLQEKSNSLNLYNIQIHSGEKLIKSYKDMYLTQKQFLLIIFFIILCFTSINMITSLVNYIAQRKKEFGVHIMFGATISDLIQRVFFQILILMSIAFAFMICVNCILNKNSMNPSLDIETLIKTSVICIILVVILSIIPSIKINNMKVNDIIKED